MPSAKTVRGRKGPRSWRVGYGPSVLVSAFAATLGLWATPAGAQDPDTGLKPGAPGPAEQPREDESTGQAGAAPAAGTEPQTQPDPPASSAGGLSPPSPESTATPSGAPDTATTPGGPPPAVVPADPNWHAPDSVDDDYVEPPTPKRPESTLDVALGAQVYNPRGKLMAGPVLRVGENLFWVAIEFSPIWLVEESPDFDGSALGNQWGFHFELAPVRTPRFELLGGLGLDVYHLWGIHGDEVLFGMTLKLHAQFRMSERASMFGTLRAYPLSSSGLELGRDRRGDMLVPVLGSLGVEWRWQ